MSNDSKINTKSPKINTNSPDKINNDNYLKYVRSVSGSRKNTSPLVRSGKD